MLSTSKENKRKKTKTKQKKPQHPITVVRIERQKLDERYTNTKRFLEN